MCRGCYAEYGEPVDLTNTTPYAVELIGQVYMEDFMGGNCHVVLDDWNLEDENIDWTLGLDDLTDRERECMNVMRGMAENERATALAIAHDMITV